MKKFKMTVGSYLGLKIETKLSSFFQTERTLLNRSLVSVFLAVSCILITLVVSSTWHFYLSSITILTVSIITIYGEFALGFLFAVILGLVVDYFFFGPFGNILSSSEAIIRFLSLIFNQLLLSIVISSYRSLITHTIQMKQEVIDLGNKSLLELKISMVKAQRSSQYARSLIEASLDPLLTISPDGIITDVNEGSIKVTGVSRDQLIGADFSRYFTEPEKAQEGYKQVFVEGFVADYPLTIRHKNGRLTDVLYNASLYKDEDGEVLGVFAAARDVTALKEIEKVRANLLLKEQEANISKDEFLAMLSHELRTPLTTILTWAQMINLGKLDANQIKRGMKIVERNAKVQGQLIEDLLDISRIQAGKLKLSIQEIDPSKIITDAIDSTRSLASSKSIQINTEIHPMVKNIFADPNRLQQVLWNLITNAIKFSAQNGSIWITLDRTRQPNGEHVQLKVRDEGKGIKPEFIPIIFNRFSQIDSTSTRAYGGLGLGLAIVKQLVELHEGRVTVESPGEGLGTTFTVLLPIKIAVKKFAEAQVEIETAAEVSLYGLRILLVDDDIDLREAFAVMLQSYGAEIRTAESVSEGFIFLEEFNPDILISDISMPIEDGYSLIKKVRALDSPLSKIPAMALTAYAGIDDIHRIHIAGFQSHISKPVDARKLIIAIAKLVLPKS